MGRRMPTRVEIVAATAVALFAVGVTVYLATTLTTLGECLGFVLGLLASTRMVAETAELILRRGAMKIELMVAQEAAADHERWDKARAAFTARCPHGVQFLDRCDDCPGGWQPDPSDRTPGLGIHPRFNDEA